MAQNNKPSMQNLAFIDPAGRGHVGYVLSDSLRGYDPLAEDHSDDQLVALSHRQLLRLLMIASDTGGRFERSGITVDPVAWLLSPRELFDGCAAVDACVDLKPFIRALVLHGLSIGLDADANEIDALLFDEAGEGSNGSADDFGEDRPLICDDAAADFLPA